MLESLARSSLRTSIDDCDRYDAILLSLPRRTWQRNDSLLDHTWIIETRDKRFRKVTTHCTYFDVGTYPGERLTDEANRHLLLTAKLSVYYGLDPGGCTTSSKKAGERNRNLIWLIRWMREKGLCRMSQLSDLWLKEFCEDIRKGVAGLIPIEDRIRAFLEEIELGRRVIPTVANTGDGRLRSIAIESLLEDLALPGMEHLPDAEVVSLLEAGLRQGVYLPPRHRALLTAARDLIETRTRDCIAPKSIEAFLYVWDHLSNLSDRGLLPHDPLGFKPFDQTHSVKRLAASLSTKEAERTPTAPANQTCFLADRALRWVFDYSDDLKVILELLRQVFAELQKSGTRNSDSTRRSLERKLTEFAPMHITAAAPGAPWPLIPRYNAQDSRARNLLDGVEVRRALFVLLPVACAIVIATFAARRKEEIESLHIDCVDYDADNLPWLSVWIEELLRQVERIPIPQSVVKAVEVLEWLGRAAREADNVRWLFHFRDVDLPGGRVSFDFGRALHAFVEHIEVPPLPDGTKWVFQPHQFRRFFGITYYHRFRYSELTALSDFFGHFDPNVTRIYVTEVAPGELSRLREEQRVNEKVLKAFRESVDARAEDFELSRLAMMLDRFTAVARGEEMIGGFGGEQLKRDLESLISEARRNATVERLGDEAESFGELLQNFVRGRYLEPNSEGHSYCKCGSSQQDLSVAACLEEKRAVLGQDSTIADTKPDRAYASDVICAGCPQNVQLPENEGYWLAKIVETCLAAKKGITPHLRCASCERLKRLEAHHRRCFIEARPIANPLR